MGKHEKPSPSDHPKTISDDTWTRLTATEQWETTPAALSAANAAQN